MKKVLFLVIIILLSIGGVISYNILYNKSIKDNFNEYVETSDTIDLYIKNGKYTKVGKISKNIILNLEKIEDKYYKIKNTNYYIKNKNLKESKEITLENYIPYNENVITTSPTILYNGESTIEINESIEATIVIKKENSYIIKYLNNYYEVKKDNVKNINNTNNTELVDASYIPVLYFSNISNEMKYNNILSETKLNEFLTYIKDNNYKIIDQDKYKLWVEGSIRLEEKSILLISDTKINDDITVNKLNEIQINNKASKINEYNAYKIDNNINMSHLMDILNGKDIITKNIDDSSYATYVPVLNYHFFYDETSEACNESICLEVKDFEAQLKYLNDNGYKTLTMSEYVDWYNGKIELPKKSVLLTIDDGAFGTDTHLPRLLNKYQANATLFLITAWWPKEKYVSPYLEIESHGHDVHRLGTCGSARITCLSHNEIIEDLNKSVELLNTKKSFCYPFYAYNNTAIKAIEAAGFEVAFAGGGYNSTRNSFRYTLPRYPIYINTSLSQFISMVD